MNHAIVTQPESPVSFGGEFRPLCHWDPVFQHHSLWAKSKSILSEGTVFPLDPIKKADYHMDNAFMIDHRNDKCAEKFEDELLSMIASELHRGFCLVLPLNSWHEIPNYDIAPISIVLTSID
jgi:hypothetical protein